MIRCPARPVSVTHLPIVLMAAVGFLLAPPPTAAGTLTSEVHGVRVEILSNPREPRITGETEYIVRLVDYSGRPITDAQVTLRGGMADGMSVIAPLRAAAEAGIYRGRVLFTMEGKWDLTLRVTRAGRRFELPLAERVGR